MADPAKIISENIAILESLLCPHGFRVQISDMNMYAPEGTFSGAFFEREKWRFEFIYRFSLMEVFYSYSHIRISHEDYMRTLGVEKQSEYPGYPQNPQESFQNLANDMRNFCDAFLTGNEEAFRKIVDKLNSLPDKPTGISAIQ